MDFKLLKSDKTIKENAEIKKMIGDMFNEIKGDKELMAYLKKLGIEDNEFIRNGEFNYSSYWIFNIYGNVSS